MLKNVTVPKFSEVQKGKCEVNLTVGECFNTLKSFQISKTPGNDGLTLEFYARDHGELSNSQKQAVIALLQKKGKKKG